MKLSSSVKHKSEECKSSSFCVSVTCYFLINVKTLLTSTTNTVMVLCVTEIMEIFFPVETLDD